MSRALHPFVAVFFLVWTLGGLAAAEDDTSDPVKLVRTLQFLQDSIAHGTVASDDARRKLIDIVGKRFIEADTEIWRDQHNADAALLYVLNGGNPAVLNRLPKAEDDARRAQLIAAVAAYAGGSQAEAKALWADIDLDSLPPGLVGPAALVKANLLLNDDPAQALRFADLARLESPGTLVEEAAIRRSIEIAAKLGDSARFEFYATRYAIRFPRSMYGGAFRQRFSESYLAIASKPGSENPPRLDEILAPLGADDRREIFLEVARRAVVEARMPLAKTAAEDAAALSKPGTNEMHRATFYRATAQAISADPGDALHDLDTLPVAEMQPTDQELLKAVRSVVDQIQRWPTLPKDYAPPADAPPENAPADGQPTVKEIALKAQGALDAAAKAMQGAEE